MALTTSLTTLASKATPRNGFGGASAVWPALSSSRITPANPDASAKAPWTRTTVGPGMRFSDALAAFRAAERLAERLDAPNLLLARARAMLLYILARLGDTEAAEQILVGFGSQDRERGEIRTAVAALRLAQGNPSAAAAV